MTTLNVDPREIVLDTETTGLDAAGGDRIVEIGCVELLNHIPTGRTYHTYVNPERPMPYEAQEVHGLSEAFLADKPVFSSIVEDFFAFTGDAVLVIHNAPFDLGFLNAECKRADRPPIHGGRTVDTLALARQKFPGSSNSLDALCRRLEIDASARARHSALVDARLLAQVYLELMGGRQHGFDLNTAPAAPADKDRAARPRPRLLRPLLTDEERQAHREFVAAKLGAKPLWSRR